MTSVSLVLPAAYAPEVGSMVPPLPFFLSELFVAFVPRFRRFLTS
ncbi:hypothetical protein BH09MYX1_BH09MYX1_02050 [soil metagenome]